MLKRTVKSTIRSAAFYAPRPIREIILAACIDRLRLEERYLRLLPACKLVEMAADGDRGVVTSSAKDVITLSTYASAGTFAPDVTALLIKFFSEQGGTYMDIGANIGLMTIPLALNSLHSI